MGHVPGTLHCSFHIGHPSRVITAPEGNRLSQRHSNSLKGNLPLELPSLLSIYRANTLINKHNQFHPCFIVDTVPHYTIFDSNTTSPYKVQATSVLFSCEMQYNYGILHVILDTWSTPFLVPCRLSTPLPELHDPHDLFHEVNPHASVLLNS